MKKLALAIVAVVAVLGGIGMYVMANAQTEFSQCWPGVDC